MTTTDLQTSIVSLMSDAGAAHHQAFLESDGDDPEWPIWYAEHLHEPLGELLDTPFTKSQLIYCLMNAEFEREARAPNVEWSRYYADHFIDRFAPTETPSEDKLALYYLPTCPFCKYVRKAIDQLGLDVELRDVGVDHDHRADLIAERDRATVPVLRITSPDGSERWMPESRDIVQYLEKTYSQ